MKSCLDINLIKRVDEIENQADGNGVLDALLNKYNFLFDGIGSLKETYHIKLRENARPVIYPARKVLFAVRDKCKQNLDQLEKDGIIEKSDWVNNIVVIRKPNGWLIKDLFGS
ncbi:hypothetical protein JTB14_016226 [Gonioctena quinquepunctata]|nr:hypothetical protein JTB14_016226 [Gonioctena quinquepunctata]